MEAQFARKKKTDKHPHTNMAKAALNMLTRTCNRSICASATRGGCFLPKSRLSSYSRRSS